MKFKGTLTQWNDDRGFGFIKPAEGGQDIFAHIKSFEGQTARPQIGQSVTFEVEAAQSGTLIEIVKPVDAVVARGETLCWLDSTDDESNSVEAASEG